MGREKVELEGQIVYLKNSFMENNDNKNTKTSMAFYI